jgi:hypothetical protein
METIFRSDCVSSAFDHVTELSRLTNLPQEELAVFRPKRLALHELIVRVTADIATKEEDDEEPLGRHFRQVAWKIWADYIAPRIDTIEHSYEKLHKRAAVSVRRILTETLYSPLGAPITRASPLNLFPRIKNRTASLESIQEREHRVISGFKSSGLGSNDPFERAIYKSLYRVLGALAATPGWISSNQDLLVNLVTSHVCNTYGSVLIGQEVSPLVDAAIESEGYRRIPNRSSPILISLKGTSAAGKSSLRPMLKQVIREQGIELDDYATISPDIWRRMLVDYDSLGAEYKYGGHFTSREINVIDGKLDRYIRYKGNRDHSISHIVVDRFRFDSFSSEQIARILHDTYAKYVDTIYMYFIITPPEETVERGWQRALDCGPYKSVEDFLGHSVDAYKGMPKIFFKWLAYRRPKYLYTFLDNNVPKGTFPLTIAVGNQEEITIYDPMAFINIMRYQKINIHARSQNAVYPPAEYMAVAENAEFLKACIKRIALVNFADRNNCVTYLRIRNGIIEVLDIEAFGKVMNYEAVSRVINAVVPQFSDHVDRLTR